MRHWRPSECAPVHESRVARRKKRWRIQPAMQTPVSPKTGSATKSSMQSQPAVRPSGHDGVDFPPERCSVWPTRKGLTREAIPLQARRTRTPAYLPPTARELGLVRTLRCPRSVEFFPRLPHWKEQRPVNSKDEVSSSTYVFSRPSFGEIPVECATEPRHHVRKVCESRFQALT
jgi:hypothetical protein